MSTAANADSFLRVRWTGGEGEYFYSEESCDSLILNCVCLFVLGLVSLLCFGFISFMSVFEGDKT